MDERSSTVRELTLPLDIGDHPDCLGRFPVRHQGPHDARPVSCITFPYLPFEQNPGHIMLLVIVLMNNHYDAERLILRQ